MSKKFLQTFTLFVCCMAFERSAQAVQVDCQGELATCQSAGFYNNCMRASNNRERCKYRVNHGETCEMYVQKFEECKNFMK